MKRRLVLTLAICALLSARRAAAQEVAIGYQGLPYKASGESKTGINLGEGLLLHVGAGAEAGWDSNVFYANSADPLGVKSSAILRLSTFAELTNASRAAVAVQPGLSYDVRAGLTYRRYTSSDPAIVPYRDAWMPSAGLSLGSSGRRGRNDVQDERCGFRRAFGVGGVCLVHQDCLGPSSSV